MNVPCIRPMIFYLGIEVAYLVKHLLMLGAGFKAHSLQGYTYYTRGMESSQDKRREKQQDVKEKCPILFLHGVGLGLLPYITFVFRLAATDHPVVAVESCHLGMRWVAEVPSEDEVVDAIVKILDRLELTSTAVVAHSYGTFMASRLVQRMPHMVQSLALLDPVCFIMFDGEILSGYMSYFLNIKGMCLIIIWRIILSGRNTLPHAISVYYLQAS